MVGLRTGTACPCTKSPETGVNFPVTGGEEADEPCWHKTAAQFVSCAYFRLEPAQAGDIIPGRRLDKIKAGTGGCNREAPQEAHSEGASRARHVQCRRTEWDRVPEHQEGFSAEERTLDDIRG